MMVSASSVIFRIKTHQTHRTICKQIKYSVTEILFSDRERGGGGEGERERAIISFS